jgi:hypothetical protein
MGDIDRKRVWPIILSILAATLGIFLLLSFMSAPSSVAIGSAQGDSSKEPYLLSASTICTVTSAADSGPDTLRQCLSDAGSGDTIIFDPDLFQQEYPTTITITSGRLTIDQSNISIDGCKAGVIIDGSRLSRTAHQYVDGFRIISNDNSIKCLTIQNFPSDGVEIRDGAQRNGIEHCVVRGNDRRGVWITGTSTIRNTFTQNRISGNKEMGILLSNRANTWIPRPLIHAVVTGTSLITVTGWATPTAVVEVFADPGGEGATFLGQTVADAKGAFILILTNTVPADNNVTATATDAEGNTSEFGCYPLPRPTLVWPLSATPVPGGEFSSPYGPRLKASEDYRYDWHRGLDITAPVGSPVYAVATGTVRLAGNYSGYEDTVVQLVHEDGAYYSNYLHLSGVTVSETDTVTQGALIGYSGVSKSDFPHLHFEIRECGFYQRHTVNPFLYLPYADTVRHTVAFSNVETIPADGDSMLVTATVVVTAPRDELDFNAITLEIKDADGSLLDRRSVDFHARNALTPYPMPPDDPLDNSYMDGVHIAPDPFSTRSDEYRVTFAFDGMQGRCPMTLIASAADVHHNVTHDVIPMAGFDSATYNVSEGSGPAVITVTLDGNLYPCPTFTVDYATSDGTATAGEDYTESSDTLPFTPGTTVLTFTIPITDDTVPECNETVLLTLSNPASAPLGTFRAMLTIIDNNDSFCTYLPVVLNNYTQTVVPCLDHRCR